MYKTFTFEIASYMVEHFVVYFNKMYGGKWCKSAGDQSSNGVQIFFHPQRK